MKKLFFYLVCIITAGLTSCSKIEDTIEVGNQNCTLNLNVNVSGYDNTITKASTEWVNGDKLYVIFYKPDSSKVNGIATYSSTKGWTVSFDGYLTECSNVKCEVRYFEKTSNATDFIVGFNSSTISYADLKAVYSYTKTPASAVTINASLLPNTARIRFKGTAKDTIRVTGISTYSNYSIVNNKYSAVATPLKLVVDASGYTPYVYGYLTDTVSRYLTLVTSNCAFTRECDKDIMKAGESGYMTIPTEDSYTNWKKGLIIKVKGVEFKMIPVSGLSSGFYLIGETEVTRQLYCNVVGNSISSNYNKPMVSVSYSNCASFISKLNELTGLSFNFPSKEQWEYAAKGGKYSLGFKYSGSNNPSDVAWYKSNTSSVQDVKQKSPNELGIYDMSGNAFETVLKFSAKSGSTIYYYLRHYGGSYFSTESELLPTFYTNRYNSSSTYYDSSTWTDTGLRLALTIK